ncbi:MAG: type II secretion system F family protein [Deltaproteobacteria bacterium]|nr:type II secretion system F family protein [Deltaproteobacteria bacterium]
MIWVLSGVTFLSLVCLAMALQYLVFRRQVKRAAATRLRLKKLEPEVLDTNALITKYLKEQGGSGLASKAMRLLPGSLDLPLFLLQAGNPLTPSVFMLLVAVMGLGGFVLGTLHSSPWASLILGGVAGCGPVWYVKRLRNKRLGAFEAQFPEAVDLMARALRAGHGFSTALQMVAQEMEDPVAEEFGRTFAAYSYGKSLDEALNEMVRRVGLKDLKFFATAVIMQRDTGGNLTEILDNIGYLVRERFRMMRQLKAISAQGRLSGTILSCLAPLLLVALWFISPHYLEMMLTHPKGKDLLMAGLGFQLLGMYVIRRMVRFHD